MNAIKQGLDKILGNEITAFLFVFSNAVGAFASIAAGYYLTFKLVVLMGAY